MASSPGDYYYHSVDDENETIDIIFGKGHEKHCNGLWAVYQVSMVNGSIDTRWSMVNGKVNIAILYPFFCLILLIN